MDDFEDSPINYPSLADWLFNNNEDARHDSGDENPYLLDDYVSPCRAEDADVPMPTVEVPDTQQSSQWPGTPSQPSISNNCFIPSSNKKSPTQSRPSFSNPSNVPNTPIFRSNFINPSNNTNTQADSRPNFFNPSRSTVYTKPRSIFGPSITEAGDANKDKDMVRGNGDDWFGPTIPYRESVQSQITARQPIPQSRETLFTTGNEVGFSPHRTAALEKLSTGQANMSLDSDSDDDIKIIDATQASVATKRKWQEPRPPVVIEDDEPIIKAELTNDNDGLVASRLPKQKFSLPFTLPTPPKQPGVQDILAAQRAILNKDKASKDSSHTNGVRRSAEKETSLRISNAKKRPREGQVVTDDLEQVDAAMRAGSEEDDSWMHEEPEGDDDHERHEMKARIDMLAGREANGKINEAETYELGRLRKQWFLKERLLRCARGSPSRQPQEESLFVPDDREEMLQRKRREQRARQMAASSLSESEGGETGVRESSQASDAALSRMLREELDGDGLEGIPSEKEVTKPKKARKKVARDAREFFYRQEDERRERERSKAQKQKQKAKGGKIRKPAVKGKASAGKKGKSAAKGGKPGVGNSPLDYQQTISRVNQRSGIDEIGQMIINDLMNNDPITERLQNPIFDAGPEPEMRGQHTKSTQLQRLLANIPEGSNTKDAKNDKAKLQQASRSFGYAKVKAVDGKWLIKGMKSTLYHHQLLGAQWMIERELSDEAPYGGLLADGMGLGKTVQTLACMVGNPPGGKDRSRGVKATLIVVPSSVIEQWLDEIRNHAEASVFPKVMRYRASTKIPVAVLRDLDIVVTSYQEVMRQFPFPDPKDRELIEKVGYKKWWKKACKSKGDLFSVYWYRVVLDEAHAIKNNSARTSLACQSLRSIFRWCLTGTPLLNRLEELFPYLRFLGANYSMDWKTFQRYFCDSDANDCHTRIATLLSYTMMRRTMKTTILNRAIITLPPPHPEIRYVQFSAEERIIYRITENRFRTNLNNFFASGTAPKYYAVFLVQLLRLRQCTSHPFMLERTIKECWTSSDLEELRRRLKSLNKMNIPFYEQCQVWVTQSEEERQAARDRGEEVDEIGQIGDSMPFGISDYGHAFKIDRALKTLSEKDMYSRVTCSLCSDLPRSPMLTDCNHIFCKECITTYMHRKTAQGEDDYMTCPACDKIFASFKPYRGPQANDEDTMEGESVDNEPGTGSGSGKGKKRRDKFGGSGSRGLDALGFEPKTTDSTWVAKSDRDEFPLAPSAKTAALKAILLKGFADAPLDKVVIYVQFRLLAQIVGRICDSENWGFLYLTGDSSLEHRTKAIKTFRDNDNVKILIAGLKCGGLGLNFPWANRCISLDLWWNHAVEQQAFGRIFRIGQKKETYMTRIIVKNSVDMRLLTMQLHKLRACDTAMESGEEKQKPSLSLKELARLFGFLHTDGDGEIVSIEPDYQDDD